MPSAASLTPNRRVVILERGFGNAVLTSADWHGDGVARRDVDDAPMLSSDLALLQHMPGHHFTQEKDRLRVHADAAIKTLARSLQERFRFVLVVYVGLSVHRMISSGETFSTRNVTTAPAFHAVSGRYFLLLALTTLAPAFPVIRSG